MELQIMHPVPFTIVGEINKVEQRYQSSMGKHVLNII
jgi:hypothetical protein